MPYLFNEEIIYLLLDSSDETIDLEYQDMIIKMPIIGPRPPFYANPIYRFNYPII